MDLTKRIASARLRLLDLHYQSGSGHLGGGFSCIDALITLHHAVMAEGDAFVLSKGHAAGALYVTLWSKGRLDDDELLTFARDGSRLAGHPSAAALDDVLFSTGSLGHGPSLAAGLALAARHQGSGRRVFCLSSDGEWQEGSCWEALIFAAHQGLNNLVILIDQNGLQGFGRTADVVSYDNLASRVAAFEVPIVSVDGHDPEAIIRALHAGSAGKPLVVILNTIKGRGLHFADTLESHYLPLSAAQYEQARTMLLGEARR